MEEVQVNKVQVCSVQTPARAHEAFPAPLTLQNI